MLAVEKDASLRVEQCGVREVEPFSLLERGCSLRVEVHFILENAEVVGNARALWRIALGTYEDLKGDGQVLLGALIECNALAGGNFPCLRRLIVRIAGEDGFEDVAGLSCVAGLKESVSRLRGWLLRPDPAGGGRHKNSENSERAPHRIAADFIN